MDRNGIKLLASRSINKLGDVLYDYGNSSWIASLGFLGQKMLGIYQIAELLVSIILNPFGGALADRFKRRQILLWTDGLCSLMCLSLVFISSDHFMLYGLIAANVFLAISSSFSSPAYRAYVPEVVGKKNLVTYNSHLETIVQVIKVSSPIIGFLVYHNLGIRLTLLIDSLTFLASFLFLLFIKKEDKLANQYNKNNLNFTNVLIDIKAGLVYIIADKEIFFLLIMAALVNLFLAMLTYLLPFSPKIFNESTAYATILSLSALGAIIGAFFSKMFPNTMTSLLWILGLSGIGIVVMATSPLTGLPLAFSYSGAVIYNLFETIFNIHFFSQVQERVSNEYMGRVFSTIYTLAILFMPLGPLAMTLLKNSISSISFIVIGLGVFLLAIAGLIYSQFRLK
ncbi:MFS transporter [Streptococcus henryi]|uniref:MFS transporter n=1 Tax=Streptococcus henryi TaxID=439219 RepID=UPI000379185D|nr:MFS transporter [Streptococcus henryi]